MPIWAYLWQLFIVAITNFNLSTTDEMISVVIVRMYLTNLVSIFFFILMKLLVHTQSTIWDIVTWVISSHNSPLITWIWIYDMPFGDMFLCWKFYLISARIWLYYEIWETWDDYIFLATPTTHHSVSKRNMSLTYLSIINRYADIWNNWKKYFWI